MINKRMMNLALKGLRNIYKGEIVAYLDPSLPQLDDSD
jgi:hypothetical protein